MSLRPSFNRLRVVINGCAGYRLLEDHELIEETDETVCASTLLSTGVGLGEWWRAISAGDFEHWRGLTVEEANEEDREMDARERLFRRVVAP